MICSSFPQRFVVGWVLGLGLGLGLRQATLGEAGTAATETIKASNATVLNAFVENMMEKLGNVGRGETEVRKR